jgi:outer membrane protein
MKNLSLILNGILLVAVGVLYYLHFSTGQAGNSTANEGIAAGDLKMAFINSDSVLKHYDYFEVIREKLESKSAKLDQDLRARAQSLQKDISAYQQNAANLTAGQARAVEEDLGKKQQNLQLYQQSLSQELSNDEATMNKELYAKVTDYLKKYGSEKGIQIVFKYDPSSDLLYGGDPLNITNDVIKGLNESYKTELTLPRKDSTAAPKK